MTADRATSPACVPPLAGPGPAHSLAVIGGGACSAGELGALGAGGRLAALVAHELNSPLQSIGNLLFLAERDPDQLPVYLDQARAEVGRISLFLGRLLAFAQPDAEPLRAFSCAELIDRVTRLMAPTLAQRGLTLSRDLAPDLPPLLGAPGPLAQLLFELLADAADEGGGALFIAAGSHTALRGPGVLVTITHRPASASGLGLSPDAPPAYEGQPDDLIDVALRPGLIARDGGRLVLRRGREGTTITVVLPGL